MAGGNLYMTIMVMSLALHSAACVFVTSTAVSTRANRTTGALMYSPRPSVNVESNIGIKKAAGESATLSVRVTADPPPVFTWLVERSSYWIPVTDDVASDSQQSHLYFDRLSQDEFGQYKVEVGNGIKPDYVQLFTIEEADASGKYTTAAVIGVGCGGLAAAILLMTAIFLLCKRVKTESRNADMEPVYSNRDDTNDDLQDIGNEQDHYDTVL